MFHRRIKLISLVLLFSICAFPSLFANKEKKKKAGLHKIVIDAGHGGHDGGAVGQYSKEKDISLAIALKLASTIRTEMPDVEVVMTRTQDIYQSPPTKANIANNNKGDLFVSLHCNSAPPETHRVADGYTKETVYTGKGKKKKKQVKKVPKYKTYTTPNPAHGTETYIWGVHKNAMKEKAMRENESLYLDSATARFVKDFNPNDPNRMVLYSLKTQQYFNRSANLAITVEQEFKKIGRLSREAQQRQVGIWVLQAVAMPSILVETGFISNPAEEKYLNSDKGQKDIAKAIVKALKRYKSSLEKNNTHK